MPRGSSSQGRISEPKWLITVSDIWFPVRTDYHQGIIINRFEKHILFATQQISVFLPIGTQNLEKLSEDYDPTNKITAIKDIQESQRDGKVLTGLLYVDPEAKDLRDILNVSDKPLNEMNQNELCPGSEKLKDINLGLK